MAAPSTRAAKPSTTPRRVAAHPGDELGAAELTKRVAANLRDMRKARGMSLDQLAQASGVSRAALSQIETSKSNPSIGVLWKIAAGFGVPFSELLGEARSAVSVLRRTDMQVLRSSDGRFESRPLAPAGSTTWVELYELRLAARSRHDADAHATGTRELIVVLSGALRMTVGGQPFDLGAGDSMVFPADQPHVYENPGSSEGRYHNVIIYPR